MNVLWVASRGEAGYATCSAQEASRLHTQTDPLFRLAVHERHLRGSVSKLRSNLFFDLIPQKEVILSNSKDLNRWVAKERKTVVECKES
jgi:hypothetical protein